MNVVAPANTAGMLAERPKGVTKLSPPPGCRTITSLLAGGINQIRALAAANGHASFVGHGLVEGPQADMIAMNATLAAKADTQSRHEGSISGSIRRGDMRTCSAGRVTVVKTNVEISRSTGLPYHLCITAAGDSVKVREDKLK